MTEVQDEKKNDVVDPIDAYIEAAVEPSANSGGEMKVESATAPAGFFGHKWHPTQGVILIDGKTYNWNARAHRKLRFLQAEQAEEHPAKLLGRVRIISWEPHIVTWYMIWIGEIANTLWVVNGLYATWPEQAKGERAEMISYVTGVIGAFLFIVTGYLGYIEAINQTYADVRPPTDSDAAVRHGPRENFKYPDPMYGEYPSPIGYGKHGKYSEGTSFSQQEQVRLLDLGYPLIQDVSTKHLITAGRMKRFIELHSPEETEKAVVGRDFDIRVGDHVIRVCAKSFAKAGGEQCLEDEENAIQSLPAPTLQGYCWWTWQPDLSYIGIFNALVFFVATIVFFIPAVAWWPMLQHNSTISSTVFWVYILQIIPSMGFVYSGFAAMAEASGSWIKPKLNYIGWWAALNNMVGGWGFLLYAILALPGVVGEPGCCGDLTKWGASLATFWGSCFFWIAGILQCIEFSCQHPISLSKK